MMDLIITAALGFVVLYAIYYLLINRADPFKKRGFPSRQFSVLESIKEFTYLATQRRTFNGQFDEVYKLLEGKRYFATTVLGRPTIIVKDVELVNQILIKDFSHFVDRPKFVDIDSEPLAEHLFGLTGDRWRSLRYKLAPTFTTGKLRNMCPLLKDSADGLISYLREKGKAVEAKELSHVYALNAIGSVAFGLDVKAEETLENKPNKFSEMTKKVFGTFTILGFVRIVILQRFPKLAKLLGMTFIKRDVTEFFIKLVDDTVKYRKETGTKRNDFLQLMINLKEKSSGPKVINEKEPIDEQDKMLFDNLQEISQNPKNKEAGGDVNLPANSVIFITAGSESISSVLSFALYELGANKDIHDKLQKEIDSVLSGNDLDQPTVNSMTYLEQFISEVLRLHPPVGAVQRLCTQDYQIPGTNDMILKGDEVLIPIGALQKDPMYFPDPLKFNPEHFKDVKATTKEAYYPFGAGPRFCIAMRFALMEMKIFIVLLMREFNITLNGKTKVPLKYVSGSIGDAVEGGLWIDFEQRNK